jgi:hypothetical protein
MAAGGDGTVEVGAGCVVVVAAARVVVVACRVVVVACRVVVVAGRVVLGSVVTVIGGVVVATGRVVVVTGRVVVVVTDRVVVVLVARAPAGVGACIKTAVQATAVPATAATHRRPISRPPFRPAVRLPGGVPSGKLDRHNPIGVGRCFCRQASGHAHRVTETTWVGRSARFGLACRGALYLVIALLAIELARGHSRASQTDARGALETIARHRFGFLVVVAIGVGFGCLGVWQAVLAVRSWAGSNGWHRLAAAGKAAIDFLLCFSAFAIAAHRAKSANGDAKAVDITGRVLHHTGGRFVVAGAGVAIGTVGVGLIVKGICRRFDIDVAISAVPEPARGIFETFGVVGMLARGVVVALAGYFLLESAITFNPAHTKGLDGVLASIAHDPWGRWLLGAVSAGLACFGVFSLLEARYARTGG